MTALCSVKGCKNPAAWLPGLKFPRLLCDSCREKGMAWVKAAKL